MLKARRSPASAFTLVELLVVIGIIALLISVLLPSLAKARKAANTVKCAANIRSILQGMQMYAAQHNGSIPGTAYTTSRFLYVDPLRGQQNTTFGVNKCPSVIQVLDWATPIARIMGAKINDEGETAAARNNRFEQLRNYGPFVCPENQFLAVPFGGSLPQPRVGQMFSYTAALGFLVQRYDGVSGVTGLTVAMTVWNPPSSYNVKVSKVGDPTRKIFVADGARYSTVAIAPDVDISLYGTFGGAFADQGPATRFSRSWDRGNAPGNTPEQAGGTVDARLYAYRHGANRPRGAADSFRFNAGFFDGHVETLGDLAGSDPRLWFPKGTELQVDVTQIHRDTHKQFFNNQTFTAPNYFIIP